MTTTKVKRGYKITIPADIRKATNIKIGDQLTLFLETETNTIKIILPRKSRSPIKLGRDITPEAIEESITKGLQQ
jgi:AbrB family looped-hinge helix DNA binding protein